MVQFRVSAAHSERRQRQAAAGLQRAGAVPGDRVAIAAGNHPDVISVALGGLRAGVIPVMVNEALLAHERQVILDDCRPVVILNGIAEVVAFVDSTLDQPAQNLAPTPLARPMHYTSGTTGRPKGVWSGVLGEAGGAALLAEETEMWGFSDDDVNLVCSPLYHSAPLRFAMSTLAAGGDVVVLDKFSPESASLAIAQHRPTVAFMAPAHLQRLLSGPGAPPDFGSFRLLAHAGAPCPAPLKGQVLDCFPPGSVWEFYGATEGQFTACSTDDFLSHRGSVGRARPHRQLRIDPVTGEIWCTVPSYARFEYFGDAEKTEAAWRGDEFTVFDLGRLDDEGYLYLDGRRDDLIISGGVNVYPLELEIAIAALAGVEEAAVFGVDDEQWGQRVCAAVVVTPGMVGAQVTVTELRAHIELVLAPYKRPKDIMMVAEIPYTPTGKVRRSTLAADLGVS